MNTLQSKIKQVIPDNKEYGELLNHIFATEEEKAPITVTLEIPVKNGIGNRDFGWLPTFGAKASGYAEIVSPEGGTWDILVYDSVAQKYITEKYAAVKGEKVYITYRTKVKGVRPVVNAKWSESKDTTLEIKLVGKIG